MNGEPQGPAISAGNRVARRIFAPLGPNYDAMAEALSFGQNGRWRRFMVSRVRVPAGGLVLDVATGTAAVAIGLARSKSVRAVVGLDYSEEMLAAGVRRVAAAGLTDRVRLLRGKGERLPFADATFDAVTFTYLMRYVEDPYLTLLELTRVLKPGGTLANLEFHVPRGLARHAAWRFYTDVCLPAAGRTVSAGWYEVGRFLGPNIRQFYERYPLEDQLEMWRDAGVVRVRARVMSLGGGVVIWGRRE